MKLSKPQEKKIMKVYNAYWDNYLKGDVEAMHPLLAADYTQVGSAEGEVFSNKKDAVQFLYNTIDQVAGKLEMRNRSTKTELRDNTILIHERCDLYVLDGKKWIFYSKFRATTLMHEKKKEWKITHQHSSFPDTKAEEGQNIAIEKIAKENQQLREAVKRRTVELDQRNRELEIETALEKVRAVAMGMKEPADMPDVCKIISLQLQSLGVKEIRNVQTAIFYESRGTYMNYEYYAKHKKIFITETVYTNHKVGKAFAAKMLKGKGEFSFTHIKGNKVKDWITYQKTTNVFIDRFLEKASSLTYYWYSLGPVALGISTYVPLKEEEINLFKRFLNVFELAYTRYLDIEKAIAQAREAQVETSLERVRSRTMAMHQSRELNEAAELLYAELTKLGIEKLTCGYTLLDDKTGTGTCYMANPEGSFAWEPFRLDHSGSPGFLSIYKSWKKQETFHSFQLSGQANVAHNRYLAENAENFPIPTEQLLSILPPVTISNTFNFRYGYLLVVSLSPFSKERVDIIKRFTKVFEQTYTRFLDLQKAEAQTREAEIELALERVRARTMAMQKSEELPDAANVLFQQVQALGMPAWSAGYCTWNEDKSAITAWMSSEGVLQPPFTAPTTEDELFIQMRRGHEKSKTFHVVEMGGAKLVKHYRYMRTLPVVGKILDSIIEAGHPLPTFQIMHHAYFSKGFLLFITYEPVPEAHDIFKRFGKVFDQTYTRFLDLQKAEAQAREAQIELGLERVRARAMAMQKSDELSELVDTVFKELTKLDFALNWCIINIIDAPSLTNTVWAANPETNKPPESYLMKFEDYPFHHSMMKGYQERKTKHVYVLDGKEKKTYDDYLFNKTEWRRVPKAAQAASRAMKRYVATFTFSNFGGLQTVGEEYLSEENLDILSRFGKVFDLTYTRFNDLKQAEAQAREAKIEASLERVRAQAMAMYKPDDLLNVSEVMFKELTALGFGKLRNTMIHTFNDKNDFFMDYDYSGIVGAQISKIPTKGINIIDRYLTEIKKGTDTFLEFKISGKELQRWKNFRKATNQLDDPRIASADSLYYYYYSIGMGDIGVSTFSPLSYDKIEILERFKNVFQLSYQRYADLQNAEAQTKEAQIEAALERVRSHSMAMHKSEELKEVIKIVYQQLRHLNIYLDHAGFVVDYKPKGDWHFWIADEQDIPSKITHPWFESVWANQFNEAKEKVTDFFATHLNFEEKNKFYNELLSYVPGLPEASKDFYLSCPGLAASTVLLDNVGLYIENFSGIPYTDEENATLMRFGKVFQQTYTRFLDLQKAEAQAREAQIEAALERVRSRSLAMHSSGELGEVVTVVLNNLLELGYIIDQGAAAHLAIFSEGTKDFFQWSADPALPHPVRSFIPHTDLPILTEFWDARQKGHDFFAKVYSFDEKNTWFNYAFEHSDLKHIPGELKKLLLESETYAHSVAIEKNSAIIINSITGNQLSENQIDILRRFSKVFEQAYIRFLDLQKAEAQAREAQIEAALERVRSRTMAMQRSDELLDVASILFQQVKALGVPQWNCGFNIWNIGDKEFTYYPGTPDGVISPSPCKIPLMEHPVFMRFDESRKKGEDLLVYEKHSEEQEDHYRYMLSLPGVGDLLRSMLDAGFQLPTFQIDHVANFTYGNLIFITFEHFPAMHDVFKRFAKVFEQTYTRFLDLQKAEAQAREAQIEVAMERIRARAMAMHSSGELMEVANVLREQMALLDQPDLETSAVLIFHDDLETWDSWYAFRPTNDAEGKIKNGTASFTKNSCELTREIAAMYQSPATDYTLSIAGAKRDEWLEVLIKAAPEVAENAISTETVVFDTTYFHFSDFNGGSLLTVSYLPPSDEIKSLQRRAASVFELAYRRFLDLKKAEAQAREAKIETALEKVRSRSLAMHRSEELQEVVTTVFERLKDLDIQTDAINLDVFNENKKDAYLWTAVPGHSYSKAIHIPYTDSTIFKDIYDGMIGGKAIHSKVYSRELKDEFLTYVFEHTDFREIPQSRKDMLYATDGSTVSVAYAKNTAIIAQRYTNNPFSEDENEILKRFANVFEQCYTRFKDLEKAEAQAREAQIEAALEKVRSRSLAMHKSEELSELVAVLFEKMNELGVTSDGININIVKEGTKDFESWLAAPGQLYAVRFHVPYFEHPVTDEIFAAFETQKELLTKVYSFEEKNSFFNYLYTNTNFKYLPEDRKRMVLDAKSWEVSIALAKNTALSLHSYSGKIFSENENEILKRFAKVFQQSHTRFLDLQKAEAQAREAKIEAALEKVRSSSMAMHKSDELHQVINVVTEQFQQLGFQFDTANFITNYSERGGDWWISTPGVSTPANMYCPSADIRFFHSLANGMKGEVDFFTESFSLEEKNEFFDFVFENTKLKHLPEERKQYIYKANGIASSSVVSKNIILSIANYQLVPYTAEENVIIKRIGKVFEQSYTRFLDLQKAEAQVREAQIEAALERVRSKTMAMHNSQDVGYTVATLFDQLVHLGVTTNRCGILIFSNTNNAEVWTAKSNPSGEAALIIGHLDVTIHPLLQGVRHAWKNKDTFHTYEMAGDDIKNYYSAINNYPDYPTRFNMDSLPSKEFHSDFFFPEGAVFAFTPEPIAEEAALIFKRFAGVFGQTYRRYLDLQRAEAQTRQAQIETAMEKVRARALAMQKPEELVEVAEVLRKEMGLLGVEELETSSIYIQDELSGKTECWYAIKNSKDAESKLVTDHMTIQLQDTWVGRQMLEFYNSDKKQISIPMQGENRKEWIHYCTKQSTVFEGFYGENIPDRTYHLNKFSNGYIGAASPGDISAESWELLQRATSVFSLAYTRFSDLQQAEAQAREATIEAALEKVRGKAMAMHNSNDLTATASIVFTELRKLGISPMRCGVGILSKENRKALLYSATAAEEGDSLSLVGWVLLDVNPVLKSVYDNWIRGEDYFPVLTKEMLKTYYEHLKLGFQVPDEHTNYEQHGYFLTFSEGMFYGWAEKPFTETEIKILKRFASVIDLTFRRYIELQKSEANAREAVKQAALDRVRAEIASMRTIADLEKITPLIWNELTILGVPFIRCGVFIMDEEQKLIHTFLSTPDGKAIGAFHLPYTTPGNIGRVLSHWQDKKNYIDHWEETDFIEFAGILVKQGTLASPDQYLSTIPHGGFYLHFLPFLQGMLYVGNTTRLGDDEIKLIQAVADAFSTAYARYEDFNKLEAAKQQVDKTLVDLKQTQQQLVQSEKMASLGELTAGIAHEIQNPLNFVNNFSEVSTELVDEMNQEIAKGNIEDAAAIASDLKQNLEKINHHGKRAGDIVKGMLQHSRRSSGVKEPTDINKLADEYLRLAYHGLRAKDKSFNATLKTDYDETLEKVNVIPQDMGRVILNLITNAFYVVAEKKKASAGTGSYEPTVSVSTKKTGYTIEIKVKDNGNGIPQNVLDKIFQPFFTTKPTGQGTGLGLSLSYDIVKAHGGEIKVETKEGEGTTFFIVLSQLN